MLAMNFGADGAVVISGRLDASQCPAALAFLEKVNGTVTLDCRGSSTSRAPAWGAPQDAESG
jgi:hypothetical protein